MNRKMIAIVLLVVIGVLGVSAFSWAPNHVSNHQGLAIYHMSERSSYAGISALGFNQLRDVESARWMGAALASQAQATEQQISNIESARWMGAALASQAQATDQQIRNAESARWMGAALASQAKSAEQQKRDVESARWMGAALASQAQAFAFNFTSPGR